MTIHYAREQAWKALYALAIGVEPIQERIVNAMTAGLIHIDRDREGLTDDQAQSLKEVLDLRTAREAVAGEGQLIATASVMDDDEAREAAREIFEWCTELLRTTNG